MSKQYFFFKLNENKNSLKPNIDYYQTVFKLFERFVEKKGHSKSEIELKQKN